MRVTASFLLAAILVTLQLNHGSAAAEKSWLLLDQLTHAGRVTEVYENADTGIAYSSGEDGHLKVWRTHDGAQLSDFTIATAGRQVKCFAVNPRNEREVAVAVADWREQRGEILLVDLGSGQVIRHWPGSAHSLSFSPDGTLIAGKSFSSITVWERDSGTVYVGLQGADDDTSRVEILEPRTLVYHVDSGIVFLDLSDGKIKHRIPAPDTVDFAVYAPDGRLVDVSRSEYRQWDIATGQQLITVKIPLPPSHLTVDAQSGDAYFFSRAAVTLSDTRGPLFRVDGKTHALMGVTGGDPDQLFSATFSTHGVLLSGNTAGRLRRWQFTGDTLKSLPELGVTRPRIAAVAVSPSHRYLATGDSEGVVDIWDTETGVRRVFDPTGARPKPLNPNFGTDGHAGARQTWIVGGRRKSPAVVAIHASTSDNELAVAWTNGDLKLVDANSLQVSLSDNVNDGWIRAVHRSTSNILHIVGHTSIARWDLNARKRLPSIALPDVAQTALKFAFAGNRLAFGVNSGVALFDLDTRAVTSVSMPSPFCIAATADAIVALTPIEIMTVPLGGGTPRTIAHWPLNSDAQACAIRDRTFLIATADGRLASTELDSTTVPTLPLHRVVGDISSLVIVPGAAAVMLGDEHGGVHFIDTQSATDRARLINWGYDGWALIGDRDGFVAPPDAWPKLTFVLDPQQSQQLDTGYGFQHLYRPSLLRDRLASIAPAKNTKPNLVTQKSASPPQVRILEPHSTADIENGSSQAGEFIIRSAGTQTEIPHVQAGEPGATIIARAPLPAGPVRLRAEVLTGMNGISTCHVLRNRAVVQFIPPPPIEDGRAIIDTTVTLISGANELGLQCFGPDGIGSPRATTLVYAKAPQTPPHRTAYLIAVGIDQYRSRPLSYAADDARLFLSELATNLKGTGQYQTITPVPLLEADATHDNIIATLHKLSGKPFEPNPRLNELLKDVQQVAPEDAVLFYFAGHGGLIDGQYRLLTEEYSDHLTGLTDAELRAAFADLDARDLMVVLDSCESGEVLGTAQQRLGPFDSPSFAQMAYDKGMFVLVATQSTAVAREPPELGHGLLTYVMLQQGLHDKKAFPPGSSTLSVRDWMEYSVSAVPAWRPRSPLRAVGSPAVADVGDSEKTRLITGSDATSGKPQTPRDFVPPFGYNEAFLIAGAPEH